MEGRGVEDLGQSRMPSAGTVELARRLGIKMMEKNLRATEIAPCRIVNMVYNSK